MWSTTKPACFANAGQELGNPHAPTTFPTDTRLSYTYPVIEFLVYGFVGVGAVDGEGAGVAVGDTDLDGVGGSLATGVVGVGDGVTVGSTVEVDGLD